MGTNKIISGMFAQMADVLATKGHHHIHISNKEVGDASQGRAAKGHPHNHITNKKGGENHFKILAYRKAAKVLADYPVDVEEAYRSGGIKALTAIPGIGTALAKKIAEFIDTGRMHKYEEVMSQKPQGE